MILRRPSYPADDRIAATGLCPLRSGPRTDAGVRRAPAASEAAPAVRKVTADAHAARSPSRKAPRTVIANRRRASGNDIAGRCERR